MANRRVLFPRFPPLCARGQIHIWPLEARTATCFVLGLILLGSAGLLYLSLASQIATTSARIRVQWKEIEALRRERDGRLLQLAEQLSLPRLQGEAESRGFGPIREVHPLTGIDRADELPSPTLEEKGREEMEGPPWKTLLASIEARLSRWWKGVTSR